MEKLTLLAMTQNILSAMNSDEVNSITDTVESQQVAEEILNTFRDLYTNHDLGTFEGVAVLDSPADVTKPNILTLPADVQLIRWLKYHDYRDTSSEAAYHDVQYLPPEQFIQHIVDQSKPASYVEVSVLNDSNLTFPIANNRCPKYYTILEDERTLVFDSFDATHESFLTSNNTLAWAVHYKTFTLCDTSVPPIPTDEFPHLLAEAKSACFINIKEVANSNEALRARRQLIRSQRRRSTVPGQQKGILTSVDYSRKR